MGDDQRYNGSSDFSVDKKVKREIFIVNRVIPSKVYIGVCITDICITVIGNTGYTVSIENITAVFASLDRVGI